MVSELRLESVNIRFQLVTFSVVAIASIASIGCFWFLLLLLCVQQDPVAEELVTPMLVSIYS